MPWIWVTLASKGGLLLLYFVVVVVVVVVVVQAAGGEISSMTDAQARSTNVRAERAIGGVAS